MRLLGNSRTSGQPAPGGDPALCRSMQIPRESSRLRPELSNPCAEQFKGEIDRASVRSVGGACGLLRLVRGPPGTRSPPPHPGSPVADFPYRKSGGARGPGNAMDRHFDTPTNGRSPTLKRVLAIALPLASILALLGLLFLERQAESERVPPSDPSRREASTADTDRQGAEESPLEQSKSRTDAAREQPPKSLITVLGPNRENLCGIRVEQVAKGGKVIRSRTLDRHSAFEAEGTQEIEFIRAGGFRDVHFPSHAERSPVCLQPASSLCLVRFDPAHWIHGADHVVFLHSPVDPPESLCGASPEMSELGPFALLACFPHEGFACG